MLCITILFKGITSASHIVYKHTYMENIEKIILNYSVLACAEKGDIQAHLHRNTIQLH